ncbi:MAG: peptidoglycan DD-metalloendopeptidase family protein [Candidatus Doudnabacteria bacterium]|nr:peptidoglycan DD-metalloendopeptidase family protein [Candidatus Doudnabacteria bacterium]
MLIFPSLPLAMEKHKVNPVTMDLGPRTLRHPRHNGNGVKRKIKAFCTILALLLFIGGILSANAQTPDTSSPVDVLQSQKEEKRRALLEIKNKISALQKQINEQSQKIASLNNEVELFELQIAQTEAQISALNHEIEVLNLEIIETLREIHAAEEDIAAKKELLAQLIREIYRQDETSPLETVLGQQNFSDLLNQFHNTLSFQERNAEILEDLLSVKQQLEGKNQLLQDSKKELENLRAQSDQTRISLEKQWADRQGLLNATRGRESRYKQLLTEVSEEEAKVNREIFELDLAIRQQLGDKTLPPVTGSLSYPMEGILTQGYGNTGFTKLGYTYHNGIDIAAPANTPIYAAGDGIVYAVGTGKAAYGNWVVIKHTIETKNNGMRNIFTLYAHLASISARTGQGILRGDLLGLEGNTGNTTRLLYGPERGYHLHFSVFDEEGFGIKDGLFADIYGPYQIPYGYTYDPMDFFGS